MQMILFRGKRIDNGEWIEGYLICDREHYGKPDHHSYIVNHHHPSGCFGRDVYIEVDPATVGQYTGLKDRNGVRIFEGDVVEFDKGQFVVEYFESRMGFGFSGLKGRGVVCGFTMTDWEHLKVIGNIHDDPALLEV